MIELDVFSRRGCHLCDVLLEQLLELASGRADIVVHDVDTRDEWRSQYGTAVPVVECRGERLCQYVLDRKAVLAALAVDA